MTDRDALLNAITANPDDDAPRLVFADWCDEHGKPDGAFCQRELVARKAVLAAPDDDAPRLAFAKLCDQYAARTKVCSGFHEHAGRAGRVIHGVMHTTDPTRPHHHCDDKCWVSNGRAERAACIRGQCSETLRENVFHVTPDSPQSWTILPGGGWVVFRLDCPPWCEWADWQRGFIRAIGCTAADCVAHLDALLAAHPVEEVRLTTWPGIALLPDTEATRRMRRCATRHEVRFVRERLTVEQIVSDVLGSEWPAVKTWHLPPRPAPVGPDPAAPGPDADGGAGCGRPAHPGRERGDDR